MENLFDLPNLISLDYPDERDAIKKILDHFQTSVEEISITRKRPVAWIRQMISYYLFKNGYSYREIGNIFGQDRSSVYHSVKVVEREISIYNLRKREVELMFIKTDSKLRK